MISINARPAEHLIEVVATGKVSRQDYDAVLAQLESWLSPGSCWDFFVQLDDFKGWEPGAFWQETMFDLKHRAQFGRIAVVGESGLAEWASKISKLFFPREVRFFHPGQAVAARAWLQTEAARAD